MTSEQQCELIKQGKCPKCGDYVKDKGGYVRCCSCDFEITNGTWNTTEGYAIQYIDQYDDTQPAKGKKKKQ